MPGYKRLIGVFSSAPVNCNIKRLKVLSTFIKYIISLAFAQFLYMVYRHYRVFLGILNCIIISCKANIAFLAFRKVNIAYQYFFNLNIYCNSKINIFILFFLLILVVNYISCNNVVRN